MGINPVKLERVGDSTLRIVWDDGHESLFPWALLRAECPCAACKPYEPMERVVPTAPRPVADGIRPAVIRPVGRYAVQIAWSDGHTTGIYAFDYLRQLCQCEACRPQAMDEG